ncbi:hypothetical protein B8V81_1113 [Paenibacillus pasadenensis]|uniref:Uncharacterized protein n=1 Tax=Paenibacillus pasadenensis TaxID=217090 RepID=A0A2N5N984_9BACL|nr:hypothetical protein B8V81_1113 [Paenibacillus pasadenensis]
MHRLRLASCVGCVPALRNSKKLPSAGDDMSPGTRAVSPVVPP